MLLFLGLTGSFICLLFSSQTNFYINLIISICIIVKGDLYLSKKNLIRKRGMFEEFLFQTSQELISLINHTIFLSF